MVKKSKFPQRDNLVVAINIISSVGKLKWDELGNLLKELSQNPNNYEKTCEKHKSLILKILKEFQKIPPDFFVNTRDKNAKLKDLTDSLQHLQAEFENYKKRAEKQGEELGKYLKADLIAKLLPTLDSFEMALKNTSDKEKFIKGVELIFAQLYSLLESEGLRPIKAVGEQFDPYRHEVLMKQESDKEEDVILEELQKGYMLNDKVLRHSKVKVSKKVHKK